MYILFLFMLLLFGKESVSAETAKVTATNVGSYYHAHMESSSHFNHYGQILNTKITEGSTIGVQAYCIAPGEIAHRSRYYNVYDYTTNEILDLVNSTQEKETNKLTRDQLTKMQLYSHYGYGYGSHTDNIYIVATQMLIYRVIEPTVFTTGLCTEEGCTKKDDPSAVTNAMNEIQALVDKHFVAPSFNNSNVSMVKGETKDLIDTNNILNEFTVKECTNCTAKINGNTLSITATAGGTINVLLEKNINTYDNSVLFLTLEDSQNFITNGNVDPIFSRISGEAVDGEVEILKYDEHDKPLTGVKFAVYDEQQSEVCTITTSGGSGKCTGLKLGTYTVKEISTLENLIKSDKTWTFTLTRENTKASIRISNEIKKGYIAITKHDSETNKCEAQGDAKLVGAVYAVYDSNGKEVDRLEINENCYAKSILLEYGHYTVKEISTGNEGYELDPTVYNAFINDNGITINITSKEDVKKFDLHLFKVKSDGTTGEIEAEANAEFDIYLISKNKKVDTITTDEKGRANITLPYGKYKVCQVKGAEDSQDSQCIEFEIKDKDVDKIINNGPISARLKMVKIDLVSKKIIPIAGIKFKIKNLDTNEYVCQTISYPDKRQVCVFETTKDGVLYTPFPLLSGNYQLEEVDQSINKYLWNKEPLIFKINKDSEFEYDEDLGFILEVRFTNQEVMGEVNVKKYGEKVVFENNTFHYEEIELDGVTYELYADDDIYSGDGTLIYKKGDFIDKYVTKDGEFTIKDLYLGKYCLVEYATVGNHILDETRHCFELKYKDQYTSVITLNFTFKNYLGKGEFDFTKRDLITGDPLPNTKVQIFYYEDNIDEAVLIYEGYTDADGKIIIKNLFKGKFYLVESEAPEGYILNNEKMLFEIKDNGEIVKAEMTNEKEVIIDVPKTSSNSNLIFISLLLLILSCGMLAITSKNPNNKEGVNIKKERKAKNGKKSNREKR